MTYQIYITDMDGGNYTILFELTDDDIVFRSVNNEYKLSMPLDEFKEFLINMMRKTSTKIGDDVDFYLTDNTADYSAIIERQLASGLNWCAGLRVDGIVYINFLKTMQDIIDEE